MTDVCLISQLFCFDPQFFVSLQMEIYLCIFCLLFCCRVMMAVR